MTLWILSAGHGIETEGKRSPNKISVDDGRPGIMEYEFNRDIVNRLIVKLEKADIPYHEICQTDEGMKLAERVEIATTQAEAWDGNAVFMAVHSNAAGKGGWSGARGFRIFRFGDWADREKYLCERIIHHAQIKVPEWKGKSFEKVKGFYVLKPPQFPCILTENGFMTSRKDINILESDEGRDAITDYHYATILDYEEKFD